MENGHFYLEKMNPVNQSIATSCINASEFSPEAYKLPQMVLMVLGLSALSVITVIGNVLVLISIKVNKNLQTVNNYFLFSLACADLIIGLFSMNLYTVYIVRGYWPLGPIICDLWLALDYVASNASVMNLLIISFDRYFCVTKPLSYPVKRTTKMAGLMIAAAWILSFVLWAPAILFWQFVAGVRTVTEKKCYIQFFSNAVVTFGTAIAAFYLPVVIMSVLYWQISKASRSRMTRRNSDKTPGVRQTGSPQGVSGTQTQERKESEEAEIPEPRTAIIDEERESENDSTSGSVLASSNQKEDEVISNSDFKSSSPTSPPAKSKLIFFGSSSRGPAGARQKERQSLMALIFLPRHRKKRRSGCSRERKVTRTITAILLAFVVTWTPYNIMVLINTFCSCCIPDSMWTLGYWLCYINSTVNPACYALCNASFKNTFKQLLLCKYRSVRSGR